MNMLLKKLILTRLLYDASNVRIRFYGDITPTMIFELISANEI